MAEKIESCQGADKCSGKKFPVPRPIVFPMEPTTVRIMVVTEQPKGIRENVSDLKRDFDVGSKNSLPRRLVELLGTDFSQSVRGGNGLYYWTHFIKCPGEFRKEPDVEENKCADTWLWLEVLSLKPRLIISVGSMTNRWLFGQVPTRFTLLDVDQEQIGKYKQDWREYLWREITECRTARLQIDRNVVANIICLFHPSEQSGIGWFIDRKLKSLVQRSVEEVKDANK